MACAPLLRIFRVYRIVRAARLMRAFGLKHMINEVVNDRADSALLGVLTSFLANFFIAPPRKQAE